jgi:hypothetical protein
LHSTPSAHFVRANDVPRGEKRNGAMMSEKKQAPWVMAWRILAQIFYVAVVLLVFSKLQGRLEVLIVALFGLIYATFQDCLHLQCVCHHEIG